MDTTWYHDSIKIPEGAFHKLIKRYGAQIIEHGLIVHSYSDSPSDNKVTVAVHKPELNDSVYASCLKSEVSGYLFAIADNM